mmetsp:Transcript_65538/g.174588  ORF Transcript_65538/g.174588 Transcript_65538/m.174588 type:complete len:225 (+) Transcript_65538:245-919(+)
MGRRAVGDHQGDGQAWVLDASGLHVLQDLEGEDGAHALGVPDRVVAVCEGAHLQHHLLDHVLPIIPALPTDRPQVHLARWRNLAPNVRGEGGIVAELRAEEDHTVASREVRRDEDLRGHLVRHLAARVLRAVLVVADPRALDLAHLVCGIAERVGERSVLARRPRARADQAVQGVPLALVLVQPTLGGEAAGAPLPHHVRCVAEVHGPLQDALHSPRAALLHDT